MEPSSGGYRRPGYFNLHLRREKISIFLPAASMEALDNQPTQLETWIKPNIDYNNDQSIGGKYVKAAYILDLQLQFAAMYYVKE